MTTSVLARSTGSSRNQVRSITIVKLTPSPKLCTALIEQIERPFRPDDGKDLGHAWGRQEQITPTMHRLAKPNALMFFHMPLYVPLYYQINILTHIAVRPETYAKPDRNPLTGKPLDVGISGIDDPGNAKDNDGFFEEGVLKASESLHVANGNAHEVKVIGNGHCHGMSPGGIYF